jgi:hypothetical protein
MVQRACADRGNGDCSHQLLIFQHWDSYRRASPRKICKFDDVLIAFKVRLAGPNIVDVSNLFGSRDGPQAAFRMGTDHLTSPHRKLGWRIVECNTTEDVAVIPNRAWQICVAFSSIAPNTGSSSPDDELMTFSTSDVAVCCSRASCGFAL